MEVGHTMDDVADELYRLYHKFCLQQRTPPSERVWGTCTEAAVAGALWLGDFPTTEDQQSGCGSRVTA